MCVLNGWENVSDRDRRRTAPSHGWAETAEQVSERVDGWERTVRAAKLGGGGKGDGQAGVGFDAGSFQVYLCKAFIQSTVQLDQGASASRCTKQRETALLV